MNAFDPASPSSRASVLGINRGYVFPKMTSDSSSLLDLADSYVHIPTFIYIHPFTLSY